MDNLTITRLCAEAMGHPDLDSYKEANDYPYDPLHDDAQAMALVKKFPEECLQAMTENLAEYALSPSRPELNFNRAICECVARMQAARQGKPE